MSSEAVQISGRNGSDSKNRNSATEETPLVSSESGDSTPGSTNSSEHSAASEVLWGELENPWPSTYERSISLLATPLLKARQVDLYTKSPKPGSTPLALSRRTNLQRGYYTPDRTTLLPPKKRSMSMSEHDGFQKGVAKVQSLDFSMDESKINKACKEQQRKAKEAKAYRAEILRKQDEEDGIKSPGYGRELASTRRQKQQQQQVDETLATDEKSTSLQCSFNLANILMGVGILSLPFVFKSAGWFGGFLCIAVFGAVTWRTTVLLGRELNGDPRPSSFFDDSPFKTPLQPGSMPEARMLPPIRSFPDIARASFGETGCLMLSAVLYFELFSCICIFFVAIGDHLHQLFPTISAAQFAVMTAAVSTIPTILLRTPTLLSYMSMVGTFATVAVVLSVFASAIAEGDIAERVAEEEGIENAAPYHVDWRPSGLTLALGLVAYCFSGHAVVPAIYTSMKRPQEFEKMVTSTFFVVGVCCVAVAVSGYYVFGSTVQDQITLSLERSSKAKKAMIALTWLMIMTVFSKIALTMFPLALGLEETVAPYLTSERMVNVASSAIKLTITVTALLVAIFVPSFSFLCSLVGMVCTMAVSVIFPAAAHLQLFGPKLSMGEKLVDWFFIVAGSIMAVVGTIAVV